VGKRTGRSAAAADAGESGEADESGGTWARDDGGDAVHFFAVGGVGIVVEEIDGGGARAVEGGAED